MPAFNAELTLERTYRDIPEECIDEIILTDDWSSDRTVEIAEKLGLTVLYHEKRSGYGANQKTCYDAALERGAELVFMIYPDYQYDSRLIPHGALPRNWSSQKYSFLALENVPFLVNRLKYPQRNLAKK